MLFNKAQILPLPDKSHWLGSVVPGPYTTMRTIDSTSVVEFEKHIHRLVRAAQSVIRAVEQGTDEFGRSLPSKPALELLLKPQKLQELVVEHLGASIKLFHDQVRQVEATAAVGELEKRITILLNWGQSDTQAQLLHGGLLGAASAPVHGVSTWVYVEVLPPIPRDPVHVVVRRRPPEARMYEGKDSKWVIQRKTLEREKGHANEVVLADEQGRLLEGTQTNFYAVIDGELWTAGNDLVLPGTIREIVLRVCERNSIPVRFEPPPVDSHKKWSGAFISSTSRLVLPIASLDVYRDCFSSDPSVSSAVADLTGHHHLDGHCPTVELIREGVLADLRHSSHELLLRNDA